MARPVKLGIDYFPADVNMFFDRKIKRLLRTAGGNGFTIYINMLTRIYSENGYFYEWDEHSAFDISDDLNFTENQVQESINACCSIGLFNKDLFTEFSVLTSESIQERWQKIVKDANRSETKIDDRFEIIGGITRFFTRKTPKKSEETPQKSGKSTQSKGKESKEEESTGEDMPENPEIPHYPDEKTFIDYGRSAFRYSEGFLKELYSSKIGTAQNGYFVNGAGNKITNWKLWMKSLDTSNTNWNKQQGGKNGANKHTKGDEHAEYLLGKTN